MSANGKRVWITSDTHLGHANIIKYCMRPFMGETETERLALTQAKQTGDKTDPLVRNIRIRQELTDWMDTTIIDNLNAVIRPEDELWHLGDFCFTRDFEEASRYRERIHCRTIHLLWGNHDKEWMKPLFASTQDLATVSLHKQKIVLCHYAMRVWNGSHYGVWHLYGHSHGSLPDDPNSLSFDVGVDCWGFRPLCFEEIASVMAKKTWQPMDHHGA